MYFVQFQAMELCKFKNTIDTNRAGMIEFTTVTGEILSPSDIYLFFELSSRKELRMKRLVQFLDDFIMCVRFANEYRWNKNLRQYIIK